MIWVAVCILCGFYYTWLVSCAVEVRKVLLSEASFVSNCIMILDLSLHQPHGVSPQLLTSGIYV